MMSDRVNDVVKVAVYQFQQTKTARLEELYRSPVDYLKENEKDELIKLALSIDSEARTTVRSVLNDLKVDYPETVLRRIFEFSDVPDFISIDWDSVENAGSDEYVRVILDEDKKKMDMGLPILIGAGCLAIGSIVMLCLIPEGNPFKKIFVIGLVVSAAVGGCVALKKLFSNDKSNTVETKKLPAKKRADYTTAIEAAKNSNIAQLHNWCQRLQSSVFQALEGEDK